MTYSQPPAGPRLRSEPCMVLPTSNQDRRSQSLAKTAWPCVEPPGSEAGGPKARDLPGRATTVVRTAHSAGARRHRTIAWPGFWLADYSPPALTRQAALALS